MYLFRLPVRPSLPIRPLVPHINYKPFLLFSTASPQPHVKDWGVPQVLEWAKKIPGLIEEDVEKLKQQRLTGSSLFTLTSDELEKCGLPLGPRKQILSEIEKLKMDSEGSFSSKFSNLRPKVLYLTVLSYLKDEISIAPPPQLLDEAKTKQQLGPFFKMTLPMTNDVIDMRFAELPKDAPDTFQTIKLNPTAEQHIILVGKSGCGKTRMMFDVARKYFTVFFECGIMEEGDKLNPGTDRLMMKFFDDVRNKSKIVSEEELEKYVGHRIVLEVVSRILYLRLLFDRYPKLTPEEYLVSQLNGAQKKIENIQICLMKETKETLHLLLHSVLDKMDEDILKNQRIIFAVDEVNVGYKILKDRGIWRSPKSGSPKGVLTPFIQYITSLTHGACTIYAGTSISMTISDTIQSDIGKESQTVFVFEFPHLELKRDVPERLNMWLQLDGIGDLRSYEKFKYTEGRGRFSSMIPVYVARRASSSKSLDKIDIWKNVLTDNHMKIKAKLVNRLSTALQQKSSKDYHNFASNIERLYIGAKLGKGIIHVGPDENLVDIGLASLKMGEITNYCTVKEPLAIEALIEVYEIDHKFGEVVSKILLHQKAVARGEGFQEICACLIKSYTESYPGSTVFDFLKKLYGNIVLPSWTKNASMTGIFNSVGSYKELRGYRDDNHVISHMLKTLQHGMVLVPQPQTRPDLLALNLLDNNMYWGLICSTKLYSHNLSGEAINNDRNSTQLDLFYYTKDGTKVNCTNLYNEFVEIRKEKIFKSLRLHIILPGCTKMDLVQVQPNEDIIAYIDLKIFKNLCGEETEVYNTVCSLYP